PTIGRSTASRSTPCPPSATTSSTAASPSPAPSPATWPAWGRRVLPSGAAALHKEEVQGGGAMRTVPGGLTLAWVATAALGAPSCQQMPAEQAGNAAPLAPSAPLWSAPRFTRMLQAYDQKLPAGSRALLFEMSDVDATLQLQDQAERANVVSYDYR